MPITITADGKTFTKQFSYALSLQGNREPGKGVAEEISYAISQDGTNPPTSGWSGTRPTPKAGWYMWTRTRFKYTDNTYSAYFYLVAQQGKMRSSFLPQHLIQQKICGKIRMMQQVQCISGTAQNGYIGGCLLIT